MPLDDICLIGSLGLQEHEVRLVKSILKHSNGRNPGRFDWTVEPNEAHLIIVDANSDDALKVWLALSEKQPAPVLLSITSSSKGSDHTSEFNLTRPFSPSRLISMLDKIYSEKLAEMLGGTIFEGREQSTQFDPVPSSKYVSSKEIHALVVDDSPTVRKQLLLELETFKIKVDMAETGEQCLSMLEQQSYDIIFLDVILPGIDGYDVCKSIRKNMDTKRLPVVMLTSKSSSFDRVRGSMAGCSTYLTKPVDYEKFHKVLEEYLVND